MPNTVMSEMTDEEVLCFSQKKRRALLNHILAKGFPSDKDGQQMVLATLDGMDRQALGNKRIGATEKLAGSERLVAQAITEVIKHFGSRNPFETEDTGILIEHVPDMKLLPQIDIVPGELGIGLEQDDFTDFVKDFED